MLSILPKVPSGSGVYIFKRRNISIYIGKAANLKKRLASYFRKNAGGKVRRLLGEATKLEWIETESEAEALIKEAELIKKYRPKFNILMRDDKSYFYVVTTKDKFPRILVVHKTALVDKKWGRAIGPFTSGSALRATLKLLRRIFPYCTCKRPHKRPCLNTQIGRCPGYCCIKSQESRQKRDPPAAARIREYGENIKRIIAILSGRKKRLVSQLKKEMWFASREQAYERAAKLRDQIEGVQNIFSHASIVDVWSSTPNRMDWVRIEERIREMLGAKGRVSRVEGYDISNISGTSATGSMVVFIDGLPAKSEYRKFKIKTVAGANDVAMHREVIRRRLAHAEWPYPDLMLIDGGKPQLNAILAEMSSPRIGVAALAKRKEELYTEASARPVRLDSLPAPVMHFFQRVRDESHRFAKKYHHKLREISYRLDY